MKIFHSCSNQGKCKRFHQKHKRGVRKPHQGGDEEHLLFEIFKQFLRTRLEEQPQQQEQQGRECGGTRETSQCQETGEVEVIDLSNDENDCGQAEGPKRHCHRFGPFKRGKHHKGWGKHHDGHHHGPHQHHGPHHHGFNKHGAHHHHGKHHKC